MLLPIFIASCVLLSCCRTVGKAAGGQTADGAEKPSAEASVDAGSAKADSAKGAETAEPADADKAAAEVAEAAQSAAPTEQKPAPQRRGTAARNSGDMQERARGAFLAAGVAEGELPEWLFRFDDDGRFLYAVGVSGKAAGEQRSRDRAQVDAHRNLEDAARAILPDGARPNVSGYTFVSAFTRKVKSAEGGRTGYITAVLVRIPRERILVR